MRIKKGEVVLTISPSDFDRYKKAGWKRIEERSKEKTLQYNETQKKRRLKEKGGI